MCRVGNTSPSSLLSPVQEDLAACNAVLRALLQPQRITTLAQRLWLALPAAMPADSGWAEPLLHSPFPQPGYRSQTHSECPSGHVNRSAAGRWGLAERLTAACQLRASCSGAAKWMQQMFVI